MAIESLTQNIAMATVLKKIIEDKAHWLQAQKQQQPLSAFMHNIKRSDRDFYGALTQSQSVFILECKKASPSKGLIRDDFDPQAIAQIYKPFASAISVLTDEKYFQGNFHYIKQIRDLVLQPILCKDFIIDEYQIYLARYHQADAILLMLSVLTDQEYQQLSAIAHQLNMGVLTEASTQKEVERAVKLNAKVIGINNRNLRDLTVDLNRTKQLAQYIPNDRIIISESGINTHQQILSLSHYANGFLIGSALMSEKRLDLAVRKIIFGENKICGLTRVEDAQAAYHAGAIFGGLIFVSTSPRDITLAKAKTICNNVPLNWIGIFKNEQQTHIINIANQLQLFAVQLHGNEEAEYIKTLRKALPKSCQIWQAISINRPILEKPNPFVDRYVFDNGNGGTGKPFNWQYLQNHPLDNVMLAGGIAADNAAQAMQMGCIGIDANSRLENQAGIKDATKIQQLFAQLRHYPYLLTSKGNN